MGNLQQEDLIRYLYGETSDARKSEIEASIQIDENLKEDYEALKTVCRELDTVHFSPAPATINKIMEHAGKKVKTNI